TTMLQKLFGSKPTKDIDDQRHTRALLEPDSWSPPALNSNQSSVILCQDTGDKAKLTLYDSAYQWLQILQMIYKTLPPSMNRSSHALFSQRKIAHNIDLIGEMMLELFLYLTKG
ncbi:unnamed protein product, partial [Rhizophagus irregularis]